MPVPVRFGVVGCARIARRRTIPTILREPLTELVAVASRDGVRAAEFSGDFGAEPVEGYQGLLDRPDIDAVYIPLPAALHHEWIMRALKAGKHVLAEKPLTTDYRQTEEVVAFARERGLVIMENLTSVHHGVHGEVRRMVNAGEIGAVRDLSATFGFPPLKPDDIRYREDLGGGSLMDAGVYPLSAALFFLGNELDVAGATLREEEGVDVAGSALLSAPCGRSVQIAFGFQHCYRSDYVLWGSRGRIVVDRAYTPPPTWRPVIRVESQDEVKELTVPAEDQFAGTLQRFVDSVRDGWRGAFSEDILHRARLVDRVRTVAAVFEGDGK